MEAPSIFFLVFFSTCSFVIFSPSISVALAQDAQDPVTDPVEAGAVFEVLQGINYEIDWKGMFQGDPCTGGPHGIVCDIYANAYHVVELNLGWVSDYVNNPPCSFNASIHPSILKFSYLRKLFFYRCFVHTPVAIPSEIYQLSQSLQHLTLQNNPSLVGGIPAELGNLTNLERLVLTENGLEGPIPAETGNLKKLKQLVLSHNRLGRSIPQSVGGLESLVILDLSDNLLAGEKIPSELYSLKQLQKMDLSHNLLQGPIADEICNLQVLKFLDLSYNNLSGTVPEKLGRLVNLQNLFLGSNLLGGKLPNVWDNLSNLMAVGLSNSRYAGPIPASIGELQKLNSLSLDSNQFSGPIPPNIGRLPNLYHMNLSANSLIGPVPFTPSLIGRLGRNLVIRNNTGLCYELALNDAVSDTLGLAPCGTSLPSSMQGESPTSLPDLYASNAVTSPTAISLCIILLFLHATLILLIARK